MIILDGKKIANQINQTIIPRIERLKESNYFKSIPYYEEKNSEKKIKK